MKIAFYAPLKPPTDVTPSGDRRVARLLIEALERAGHRTELISTFRSFDREGDAKLQGALQEQGIALARRLAAEWLARPRALRPDLWFTYHVYHKSPDWLGPATSTALGIPYVIAEASHAPKRASGPWAPGYRAASEAIRRADLLICPTQYDLVGLRKLVSSPERIVVLPPFLDGAPFRAAAADRVAHRARLAATRGLDPTVAWIAVAAMMRPGDKLASYRLLGDALARLRDLRWQLVVAGDGPVRTEVEHALDAAAPGRAFFLGELGPEELAAAYAACDFYMWPAVNEAYGMAILEAQAAGLPVVSCALRGVPDVVAPGHSGLLAPPGNPGALARLARSLLEDPARRASMGHAAADFVLGERSLEVAAAVLGGALERITARASAT